MKGTPDVNTTHYSVCLGCLGTVRRDTRGNWTHLDPIDVARYPGHLLRSEVEIPAELPVAAIADRLIEIRDEIRAARGVVRAEPDRVMSAGEVAALFRVSPKTVTRWAQAGLLPHFRTVGGHRRFMLADVTAAFTVTPALDR